MLHLSAARKNTVLCTGPQAEILAADVLRWPDVERVYLIDPPLIVRDKRIVHGPAPVASCQLVTCSPNDDPSPHLHAVAPGGLINVSTAILANARGLYQGMRVLFRSITPWRDWLPDPLYGAMASPGGGRLLRQRHPPKTAAHLSSQYLPCLFTFAKDEVSWVLPQAVAHAQSPAGPTSDTRTPEFSPS